MKNLQYFPFVRNRYFYGKLLSVEDFEVEQRYMNDKRRVLNRFLYGTGIVCGMNVLSVDETTISVEPGLAIDFSGREIVLDTPVMKKLSMLEGFDAFMEAEDARNYLYLCLDYDEKEKEQVHNVTGAMHAEYNRCQEGYRLYVTDREPSKENLAPGKGYEQTKVLYTGNSVCIKEVLPRFVKAGEEFEFRVIVENMGQPQPIRFSYRTELTGLEHEGERFLDVSFQEEDYEKNWRYELNYSLRAVAAKEASAFLETKRDSFSLSVGSFQSMTRPGQRISLKVIRGDVKEALMHSYYRSAMEEITRNNYQQSIYLARIFVIRAGESYLIDRVEQVPFEQYIYNNVLGDMMNRLSRKEERERERKEGALSRKELTGGGMLAGARGSGIAAGSVVLDLGVGGTAGQRFFSEELSHNLGLGRVSILLGQCYSLEHKDQMLYGSAEVFEGELPVRAETAARADYSKGTFQIGIRLIEPTMARFVQVDWTAIKDPREEVRDMEEASLFIKPGILHLRTRESFFLEAEFRGAKPTEVIWAVKEEAGGSIEQNGRYTAPNISGIYEVTAKSAVEEKLRASIFVVVRDDER